jgi:ElaB/YqjD/DUF883 family membrane-anchored ribosome-binding protein
MRKRIALSAISDAATREAPIPACMAQGNYALSCNVRRPIMEYAAAHARTEPFNELLDSVDDLLKRIADVDSPEIKKIRTKVQVALAIARSAWQDTALYANRQVRNSLEWPNDYLRESPWRAIGIATVVGMGVGALLIRSHRD